MAAALGGVLVARHLGLHSQEVPVQADMQEVTVPLQPSAAKLEEVLLPRLRV